MTTCEGTGQQATSAGSVYPHCPICGREFGAQGRKAQARLGNAWQSIPRHMRVV